MRFLLVLILAISVPSCAMTTRQKHVGYAAGAVVAALGIAAVIAAHRPCDQDASLGEGVGCLVGSIELDAVGIALTAAGVATVGGTAIAPTLELTEDRPAIPSAELAARVAPSTEPTLVELTERASMAGRVGQCKVVAAIAERVEMRDSAYRFGEFAADGAIASCL
jgi:hypothetical protein